MNKQLFKKISNGLNKNHIIIGIIFLLIIILNVVYFLILKDKIYWGDERWYIENGRAISLGEGFDLTSRRVPGQPYFLAIWLFFGNSWFWMRLSNLFLGILSAFISYKIAYELYADKKSGFIAAILTLAYPFFVYMRGFIISENLTILFLLLFTWLVIICLKKEMSTIWLLTGFVAGVSVLVRPVLLFAPLIIPVLLFFKRDHDIKKIIKYTTIFTVAFCAVIFLWMYRNYVSNGEFNLASKGFCEIYKGMATPPGEFISAFPTPDTSQGCKEASISFIINEFPRFIYHKLYYAIRFWSPQFDHVTSQKNDSLFQIFAYLLLIPLYIISILGLITIKNNKKYIILSVVIIYWFFHIATVIKFRYRIPVEALLLILSVGVIERFINKGYQLIESK